MSMRHQVANFDVTTGGPMTAHMAPKLDDFLAKVYELTGFEVPIKKADYPRILLAAAVCEGLGAGLFLMDISFGAIVLLIFLVPTSCIMHNFWDAGDAAIYNAEMIHFLKVSHFRLPVKSPVDAHLNASIQNMSMIGSLLVYLGSGSGTTLQERKTKTKYA